MITAKQIRMARTGLDWSQDKLAQEAGVGVATIGNIEKEQSMGAAKTLEKIERCLSEYYEFLPNNGITEKKQDVKTYRHRIGFLDFMQDVYETAKDIGGEICASNVREADFEYWLGDQDADYTAKMDAIQDNFQFKILIEEGDLNFSAGPYAEYRWIPKEYFSSAPFYVYGDNLALINFSKDVTVFVIHNPELAGAQRRQFEIAWSSADIPVIKGNRSE